MMRPHANVRAAAGRAPATVKDARCFILLGALLAAATAAASASPPAARAWASESVTSSAGRKTNAPARLSEEVTVRAAGRGAPYVNLSDGRELVTSYEGEAGLVQTLRAGQARPLSLASADFDEDGTPDLVAGYAAEGGGGVTLSRGNVDAIYPNAPEAERRRAEGSHTEAPFLSPARAFALPAAADFLGAGDFDADGHFDLVSAGKGGASLAMRAGDGRGGFGEAREISLPGAVTAMTVGEVNRADGLTDVIVGISTAGGASVLVFEGPGGALGSQPEVFQTGSPVTGLALGQLGGSYEMDLAIAAGGVLTVVRGRDRRLSLDEESRARVKPPRVERRLFESPIEAIAIGDFVGYGESALALLCEDGVVRLLSRERQRAGDGGKGQTAARRGDAWRVGRFAAGARGGAPLMAAVYVSGSPLDDLLIAGRDGGSLRLFGEEDFGADHPAGPWSGAPAAPSLAARQSPPMSERASLETDGGPVAVLPMRLDSDALSDLVILSEGSAAPAVSLTQAEAAGTLPVRAAAQGVPALIPSAADVCARTPLTIGQTVNGELAAGDCKFTDGTYLDPYSFTGQAGQYVSVTVTSTAYDTYVDLLAPDNTLLAYDGFGTAKRTSQIIFGLPEDGIYDVRASSHLPNTTGPYTLTLALVASSSKTFIVTNTNDSGPGSLRQAILDANAGRGPDTIRFEIGTGPKTITPASLLPDITDAVTLDATTQPGFGGKPIIELSNGGFNIKSGRSVVRGFVINKYEVYHAITLDSAGANIIEGNYLGTDITGSFDQTGGQENLEIISSNNTIGGTVAAARNIISGAFIIGGASIFPSTGNRIQGNYIGLGANGSEALSGAGTRSFGDGLVIESLNNVVGGTSAGARNVISGNSFNGLWLAPTGNGTESGGNLVQGNYIGADATGAKPVASSNFNAGVLVYGDSNTIGGTTPAARNVISGNGINGNGGAAPGVAVRGGDPQLGNLIQGNYIGTDVTGTKALGNGSFGVDLLITNGNTVGGAAPGARNVISANGDAGVSIAGYIFSGGGGNATDNKVQGNFIGTDAAGTARLGNGRNGVQVTIKGTISNNTIGGSAPGTGNLISGNSLSGIAIGIERAVNVGGSEQSITGGTGVSVQGNSIGADANGNATLGNGLDGVFVDADSFTNTIARNVVIANKRSGVYIPQNQNPGVRINIDANNIHSNALLGIDLGTAGVTPNDPLDADGGANLQQNFPVAATGGAPGKPDDKFDPLVAGRARLSLHSAPSTAYAVRVSFTSACQNSQAAAPLIPLEPKAAVQTDAQGNGSLDYPFEFPGAATSGFLLATATDPQGNTSEFSPCLAVSEHVPPAVQLSQATYQFSEAAGSAAIVVTRTGDPSGTASVDYRTEDADTFTVGCADAAGAQGSAYARCDFATSVGTLSFAAGQTARTVSVPIIDDGHVEGPQTFRVRLSNASGAALGSPELATITITDNDSPAAPNPVVSSVPFFVRQQYLDFLSREPDQGGFNAWAGVLNNCTDIHTGPAVQSGCDRIFVSGDGFFRSPEFALKGAYVFRLYKVSFSRLPEYLEVVADMSFVAGATAEEVFARRAQLVSLIARRQEFQNAYGGMTDAQYAAALLGRYNLTQVTTPDPANPDAGAKVVLSATALAALPRDKALRAVADSDEVTQKEFDNAFVAMQYYGYLRRKPEPSGYAAWLSVLKSGDTRTMVNGFLNSAEYKLRFGQP